MLVFRISSIQALATSALPVHPLFGMELAAVSFVVAVFVLEVSASLGLDGGAAGVTVESCAKAKPPYTKLSNRIAIFIRSTPRILVRSHRKIARRVPQTRTAMARDFKFAPPGFFRCQKSGHCIGPIL